MNLLILQDNLINESLALTELIAYIEAKISIKIELLVEDNEKDYKNKICIFKPDLVFIPSDIGKQNWCYNQVQLVKSLLDVPVISAGSFCTFFPEQSLNISCFDYIIVGEPEKPFLQFITQFQQNSLITDIQGIWTRQYGKIIKNGYSEIISNLDEIPTPKREIYFKYKSIKEMNMKRFISGRGCTNSCSFCLNAKLVSEYRHNNENFIRQKSVRKVIEEIKDVQNKSKLTTVHFSDDQFVISTKWLKEFSNLFKDEVGLPFSCNISVPNITKEVVEYLKNGGCRAVTIGLESGVENLRMNYLGKKFTNDDFLKKVDLLHKYNIKVNCSVMLALPEENISDSLETLRLINKGRIEFARVHITMLIENTSLFNKFETLSDSRVIKYHQDNFIYDLENFNQLNLQNDVMKKYANLKNLFLLGVFFPFLFPIISYLSYKKQFKPLNIFSMLNLFAEKRFFSIDYYSGWIFYKEMGGKRAFRTKNLPSMV